MNYYVQTYSSSVLSLITKLLEGQLILFPQATAYSSMIDPILFKHAHTSRTQSSPGKSQRQWLAAGRTTLISYAVRP